MGFLEPVIHLVDEFGAIEFLNEDHAHGLVEGVEHDAVADARQRVDLAGLALQEGAFGLGVHFGKFLQLGDVLDAVTGA